MSFQTLPILIQLARYKCKSTANEQNGSEIRESLNNHFFDCLLITTIFKRLELETRGWSQTQGQKKIFPDPTYFFTIDILEDKIYWK